MRKYFSTGIGLLLTTLTLSVSAQEFSPMAEYATGLGMAVSQSHAMADVMRDAYGQGSKSANVHVKTKTTTVNAANALEKLNYTPTPQVTQTAINNYVADARKTNAAAANTLAQKLPNIDIGQIYQALVAPYGLRDGNVADTFTAYAVLGWIIANNAPDPSKTSVLAARDSFAKTLASTSTLTGSNLAAMGEQSKLLFVTIYSGWKGAKEKGNAKQYSDAIATIFGRKGMNLRSMQLTAGGFSSR